MSQMLVGFDSGSSETVVAAAGFIAVTTVELLVIVALADFITCSKHLIG